MENTVILAGSLREANAYCQDKGIRATFAKSSAQVKRATTLIQLPGFSERRDRFALASARDSHMTFSRTPIEFIDESDWERPKSEPQVVEEPSDADRSVNELLVAQLDLTDEALLAELKTALNAVGLTLKKLPVKTPDAPVVDAPVEF